MGGGTDLHPFVSCVFPTLSVASKEWSWMYNREQRLGAQGVLGVYLFPGRSLFVYHLLNWHPQETSVIGLESSGKTGSLQTSDLSSEMC